MKKIVIYGLKCPVDGKMRYVGKSTNFQSRYKDHIKDIGDTTNKKLWIKKLSERKLLPIPVVLDFAYNQIEARKKENEQVLKYIKTVYNIFMPEKKAPTVSDWRKINKIIPDLEFDVNTINQTKYDKL